MTSRILIIDTIHPNFLQELSSLGFECTDGTQFNLEEITNCINEFNGIVIRSRIILDRQLLDKASNLKFIARAGAGMESIDEKYAKQKEVICLNSSEGNRTAVGEHTLGMLLTLLNNICKSNKEVKSGKWIRESNRGTELNNKTIGIIGYGNMGKAFAKVLSGFDSNVLAYDKYKQNFSDEYAKEVSLEKIFDTADILSLHIPLNEETHYMVNDEFINKFKKDFYFINTARGKIVETSDLVKNIRAGKIKGACLDVIEYESHSFENLYKQELPEDFKYLLENEKVILTPHIAGWTFESKEKIANVLIEKIKTLYSIS